MAVIYTLPSTEKVKDDGLFGGGRREDNSFEYLTIKKRSCASI
jgi:hypothetical protein